MFKLFILGAKRLLSSAAYKVNFYLKRPVKPLFINFPITYKCNSRCLMCGIWKKYEQEPGERKESLRQELKVRDIESFLKRNKDFLSNLRSIGITGGEAFLRPDIVEILRIIHAELPRVDFGIQTNGLLPEMIREKIKEILKFYSRFKLAVSIDGVGKIHDRVRGVEGAYEKAVTTIRYAKELGIEGITCGMTVALDNFDKISEVSKEVNSLGCEFSCFLPQKSGYFGNEKSDILFTPDQLDIVAEELKEFSCHYFMDNLRSQILKKTARALPCYSGYTSYVIDPFGEILPCILVNDSFGNIKDGLMKDMVGSDKAWQIRRRLKDCKCWCQCEVSTSAIVAPFDVLRWALFHKNKKGVFKALNKKILIGRL